MLISPDLIKRLYKQDLNAFVQADAQGIFLGEGESAEEYIKRLETLNANGEKLAKELAATGSYRLEDVTVSRKAVVPEELLIEANQFNRKHFAFSNTWVPAFFINPSWSMFFGGCSFCYYPDFFALFIIRRSFQKKKKWLWYDRNELLAHEICHVARMGLNANIFEEPLAYMTASTAFRRYFGGIFRSQADSFAFIGAALFLTLLQTLRTFLFPTIPIWPAWVLLAAVCGFLLLRHWRVMRQLKNAKSFLGKLFQPEAVEPVLLRCTDQDIRDLASHQPDFLERRAQSLRWQVILRRFKGELHT